MRIYYILQHICRAQPAGGAPFSSSACKESRFVDVMGLCTGVLASVDAATERNAGRVEVDPGVRAWDAIVGRVAVGGLVARVTRVRRSSGFMGL